MAEAPGSRPPSVDALARSIADVGLPHPLLVDAARAAVQALDPAGAARRLAEARRRSLLRGVVNATGVLLHTNLGRAPLAVSVPAAATNLEFDLGRGKRGDRLAHAGELLARAAGAEAGLVVNNGAAAVMLVLAALASGRPVAVSRGELVEIGGGFRIPDVMEQSGATLVEVGTTNRTRLADFQAVADQVDANLKVHQSNYRVVGFTADVSVPELVGIGVPLIVDLGSGLLDEATPWLAGGPPAWLAGEPGVRQTIEAGADLVTFSGDKLLGGPQAGVVVGRRDLVARCAAHPLYRAVRPGSLVLSALQEVALAYLDRRAGQLPFWAMASADGVELEARAQRLATRVGLDTDAVVPTVAVAGGGTLPGVEIPSVGLRVAGDVTAALRSADPPVIARIDGGETICDLRSVDPADDDHLGVALGTAVGGGGGANG